jgi:agmatine deiminase
MRDNGPIFVTDANGGVALVHFRFNSWGNEYLPFDRDAEVPKHIASHLGMRRYGAPMVLEGGSFFVDGEGTLLTTEQCLLHPNRNPDMTREQIEHTLGEYLGVDRVIWLGQGHPLDRDTDGHIDAIAQYPAPRRSSSTCPATRPTRTTTPVGTIWPGSRRPRRGRKSDDAVEFDAGTPAVTAYMNHYLVNGGRSFPPMGSRTTRPSWYS